MAGSESRIIVSRARRWARHVQAKDEAQKVDVHIEQVLRRWECRGRSSSQKGLSAEIGEQIHRIVLSAGSGSS